MDEEYDNGMYDNATRFSPTLFKSEARMSEFGSGATGEPSVLWQRRTFVASCRGSALDAFEDCQIPHDLAVILTHNIASPPQIINL